MKYNSYYLFLYNYYKVITPINKLNSEQLTRLHKIYSPTNINKHTNNISFIYGPGLSIAFTATNAVPIIIKSKIKNIFI